MKYLASYTQTILFAILTIYSNNFVLAASPYRKLFETISHTNPNPIKVSGPVKGLPTGILIRNGFGGFQVGNNNSYEFAHIFDTLSLIVKFNFTKDGVWYQSRMQPTKYYNQSVVNNEPPPYRTLGGFNPQPSKENIIKTLAHSMHDNLNANIFQGPEYYFTNSDLTGVNYLSKDNLNWLSFQKDNISILPYGRDNSGLNMITTTHPIWITADKYINLVAEINPTRYEFYLYTVNSTGVFTSAKPIAIIPGLYGQISYIHQFSGIALSVNSSQMKGYIVMLEYPYFWNIGNLVDNIVILPTLEWHNDLSVVMHIFDLATKKVVSQVLWKTFFAFHHIQANLLEDHHAVVLDVVSYDSAPEIFDAFYLGNITSATAFPGGKYLRIQVNDFTNLQPKINFEYLDTPGNIEMPALDVITGEVWSMSSNGILKINPKTGNYTICQPMNQGIATEPVFAGDQFVLSIVYDPVIDNSYLAAISKTNMKLESQIWLNVTIPLTCHGHFYP